jgi:monofunctional biosynthetic peptidoglycan transglycosylase
MARRAAKRSLIRRIGLWTFVAAALFVLTTAGAVAALRWFDPPTTAFILFDASGRRPVLFDWTDATSMSASLAYAVIAAEDQKFPSHFGFDLDSIRDALDTNSDGGRLRGASTITQQVAKNLFLWPGRSFVRKGLEAYFTVLLELALPKERILEIYLNIAEFGPGVYGAGAASAAYFAKPPQGIADAEAALLAAVLPNPKNFSVDRPSGYLRERQRWILTQMQRLRRDGALAAMRGQ